MTRLALLMLLLSLLLPACTGRRGGGGGGGDDDDSAADDDDAVDDDDDSTPIDDDDSTPIDDDDDDSTPIDDDDDDSTPIDDDDDDSTPTPLSCPPSATQIISEAEPNDSDSSPQNIGLALGGLCITGTTVCGNGAYDDPDWFSLNIPFDLGVTTDVVLEWDVTADMDMVIYDGDGTVLSNYTEGLSTTETGSWTINMGDYLFFIGCWEGGATNWIAYVEP